MAGVEYTKLVDDVYKNILDKFNPTARQLITAGKAYLKALHASAAASNTFNEALLKMSLNAQQCGNGTSASDIGVSIANVASVYKEIHDHHTNILKAFYVDFLVPLETNLEKDTKVVQHEQKKFLQQHKVRIESYHKAASTLKKQRKKKTNAEVSEKEMKHIQSLNEQKSKLENFCEQSLKNAITQERRRYGFVLERHCSISKHWLAYHVHGNKVLESNLENWLDVAASREDMTPNFDANFSKKLMKMEDEESRTSTMKKARSVDAPYDMRSLNDHNYNQNSLPRAKSDFNLTGSSNENRDQRPIVKALYSYMPSGENQLPFAEGDRIALAGNRVKGWQFGENLRTQMFGWFPVSYTNASSAEHIITDKRYSHRRESSYENVQFRNSSTGEEREFQRYSMSNDNHSMDNDHQSMGSDSTYKRQHDESSASPTRMFGDTLQYKNPRKYRNASGMHNNPKPGPPPPLPAPVPSTLHGRLNVSQSFCLPNGPPVIERRKKNPTNQQSKQSDKRGGAAKTSLHSSNDSGFANEPPPQPEIDYSDEETRVPIRNRREKNFKSARPASSVASWTLNRQSHGNRMQRMPLNTMRQSTSFENVIESDDEFMRGNIKRTKSFWKFGKSTEILTGMSLWQHKDLVEPTANKDKRQQSSVKSKTLPRKMTNGMASTPTEDEENIYGMAQNTPKSVKKPTMMQTIEIDIEDPSDAETIHSERNSKPHKQKMNNDSSHQSKIMMPQEIDVTTDDDDEDNGTLKMSDVKNFFEENNIQSEKSPTKYLKRQEILKQYYSSDESVSSDPYDCIVIQDHAQKEEKIKVRKHQTPSQQPPMEFQTFRQPSSTTKSSQASMKLNNKKEENGPGTMLPRTKLLKSTNNNLTMEKNLKKRNKEDKIPEKDRKTYGPWYDFWEHQDVVQANN